MPWQAALDGLRAVAVLVVMAFHAGIPGMGGGFLGVDVFFVLSGFLITTLLVREHRRSGTIALARFYVRRTLRLLPALLVLVAALHLYGQTMLPFPEQVRALRRETFFTLLYVANWAQAAGITGSLGFFGHAWSLAIEEQFYIAWPLLLRFLLGRFGLRGALAFCVAGAAGSALLRLALWDGPSSFARVFHGSDTRAEALLVGCTLALLLSMSAQPVAPALRKAASAAAAAAVATLAALFALATPASAWLVYGGLSAAALASATVILALQSSPQGLLARALSLPPLVAIGRISYGLYLWHWPLFLMLNPDLGVVPEGVALPLRFTASFAAATLSWFLVERPCLRWKARWA